jgi:hypothetical protein
MRRQDPWEHPDELELLLCTGLHLTGCSLVVTIASFTILKIGFSLFVVSLQAARVTYLLSFTFLQSSNLQIRGKEALYGLKGDHRPGNGGDAGYAMNHTGSPHVIAIGSGPSSSRRIDDEL